VPVWGVPVAADASSRPLIKIFVVDAFRVTAQNIHAPVFTLVALLTFEPAAVFHALSLFAPPRKFTVTMKFAFPPPLSQDAITAFVVSPPLTVVFSQPVSVNAVLMYRLFADPIAV
jgi:hypothetical protein